MNKRFIAFYIIIGYSLLFCHICFCDMQDFLSSKIDLQKRLESLLIDSNIAYTKPDSIEGQKQLYSNNIVVVIPATFDNDNIHVRTLLLAFTQEYALANYQNIADLITTAKEEEGREYNLCFLFTSCDDIPLQTPNLYCGTPLFTIELDYPEDIICIVISSRNDLPMFTQTVIPGASKIASPMWLCKSLCDISNATTYTCDLAVSFPAFYNMDLLQSNRRLLCFLERGVAACGFVLPQDNSGFVVLKKFISQTKSLPNSTWSYHWIRLRSASGTLWFGEKTCASLFMLIATLCLLTLCGFSFVSLKATAFKIKSFRRHFLLFIGSFLVCVLSLFLSQTISLLVAKTWGFLSIFTLKLVITFLLITLVVSVFFYYNKSINAYAIGLFLCLQAVINLFIFCSIELTFLFLFLAEYIVLLVSHHIRRIRFLVPTMLLSLFPFIPYCKELFSMGSNLALQSCVNMKPRYIILMASVILPEALLWGKYILRLSIIFVSERKSFVRYAISILASVSVALFAFYGAFLYLRQEVNHAYAENTQKQAVVKQGAASLKANITHSQILDLEALELHIACSEVPVRYNVYINSSEAQAIYDASVDWTVENLDNATWTKLCISDYPPKKLDIEFIPNPTQKMLIRIDAWYIASDLRFEQLMLMAGSLK